MTSDSADGEVAESVKQFLHSILETGDINEMNFWAKEICNMGDLPERIC